MGGDVKHVDTVLSYDMIRAVSQLNETRCDTIHLYDAVAPAVDTDDSTRP